jgi:5'-3' exonuclease
MKALIDADIVAYRVACTCQEDDAQDFVFARLEDLVDSILVNTEATEYRLFLTGKDNFRYTVYPEYKAHRPKEKPFWLEAARQYLIATFNAEVIDGQEADDAMGIYQTEDTIICSIDKDLLMIPGRHYNFVKDEFITVTEESGIRHFYIQCLTGDRADNIKGIEKIGPKKAEKLLAGCITEKEMFDAVRNAYSNDEEFIMNARVLWIRRKDNEDWKDRFNALVQEQVGGTSLDSTEKGISLS